jgi:pimeloyl-ACP methyl ester carboxylesterase
MIAYPDQVNGTLTRILEGGDSDNVAIFIHGVGARADRWRNNIGSLAAGGYRCIALDLPGHGFAQKGPDYLYGVPSYAEFVVNFLEKRRIANAHLVGTSLGGHIVATVALNHPKRVRSLSLVGTTGIFPIGAEARANIATRIVDRSRDGIENKLRLVMVDQALVTSELIDEEYMINNSPGAEAAFQRLAAYFRSDLDEHVVGEKLAQMGVQFPMQLVWGDADKSVPLSVGRKAADLLRQVPLHIVERAAHCPYYERPEEFNKILQEFFATA